MKTLPFWLGHIIAAIVSLLAAFFGTFNVLFSDIFGVRDQAAAALYVLIVYTIFSILLHWLWPGHGRTWRLWLIIPAAVFTGFILISDFSSFLYPAAVIGAVIGGSWIGTIVFQRKTAAIIGSVRPPADGRTS